MMHFTLVRVRSPEDGYNSVQLMFCATLDFVSSSSYQMQRMVELGGLHTL